MDPDADAAADSEQSTNDSSDPPTLRADRPEWMTLGSMDPAAGYRMLVTLNSRGGAIERIELTTRNEDKTLKYHRVDTRTGYLGYFAGEPAEEATGVRVNVVGPGTPAAIAKTSAGEIGIQPGDIILNVAKTPVTWPD